MPVALAARRADKLRDAAERVRSLGGRAIAVGCDVTDPEQSRAFIDAAAAEFGGLYGVFANAGYGFEGSISQTPEAQLRAIFEANFWGSLNVIRPALPHFRAAGAGHVLWCSSCLSKIGMPYYSAYSATKAAQDHLARAMRHELRPAGIHVSSVHPIGTRTEFFEMSDRQSAAITPGWASRLRAGASDRFMQPPEVVADAVVRCLRRPKGEVWTSGVVRWMLGLSVMAPGTTDAVLGWLLRRRMAGGGGPPPGR